MEGRRGVHRAVAVLLLVFLLLGWQYRASVGVVSNHNASLPGSILSVDNSFIHSSYLHGNLNSNQNSNQQSTTIHNHNNNTKRILYYTKFWESPDFLFGEGTQVFQQCPVSDCWATSDRRGNLGTFDAVLFHPLDTPVHVRHTDNWPRWRQAHQRFVLVHMESPQFGDTLHGFAPGFFNWTMTYLWESDIPRPYGYFVPKLLDADNFAFAHLPARWITPSPNISNHGIAPLSQRKHEVAWIVSNCQTPSRREAYVHELAQHINVTIFGKCSHNHNNTTCDDACYEHIRQNYRFIIGLENSHCRDYVTEKFWGRLQDHVVIARGPIRGAPPHSFIDVNDFASPATLADHLRTMDDATYASFFAWQAHYRVRAAPGRTRDTAAKRAFFASSMCRLCEKLHVDNAPSVYSDVAAWFATVGQCAG